MSYPALPVHALRPTSRLLLSLTGSLVVLLVVLVGVASTQGTGIRILEPKDGATLRLAASENMPAVRPIHGDISGFPKKQIEDLGLRVEVSIQTDKWYPQGIASVTASDGTWRIRNGNFGGAGHLIKAVLKDRNGNELASTTARVELLQ